MSTYSCQALNVRAVRLACAAAGIEGRPIAQKEQIIGLFCRPARSPRPHQGIGIRDGTEMSVQEINKGRTAAVDGGMLELYSGDTQSTDDAGVNATAELTAAQVPHLWGTPIGRSTPRS